MQLQEGMLMQHLLGKQCVMLVYGKRLALAGYRLQGRCIPLCRTAGDTKEARKFTGC
uniref:Uncharacterized protein n=1 Tax=Arundo donax TaxID=35708 RepID=A0A0A9GXI3_ARUDO